MNSEGEWHNYMNTELPFLIHNADQSQHHLPPYSYVNSRLGRHVSCFLDGPAVAESEMGVQHMIGPLWSIFKECVRVVVYADQHDASSQPLLRPDGCLYTDCGALCLKFEGKASIAALDAANIELSSKLHPQAWKRFPRGQTIIPAITACATRIVIHFLKATATERSSSIYQGYDIPSQLPQFLADCFKIMRWIAAVTVPNEAFHLIPSVRVNTGNKHYVRWDSDGLMKWHSRDINMDILRSIYAATLQNVERGVVIDNKTIRITSIGVPALTAIAKGDHGMTKDIAITQVRQAVEQLHGIGVAHCDIRWPNIFVVDGVVVLGDLEYCQVLMDRAPRLNPKYPSFTTAKELDYYLLGLLASSQ
jgi:hypothetical protein